MNKKYVQINKESGFSLLEVMISLVILATGLLGMAMLQITAIKGNAYSMDLTEAEALIANKIEDYRHMPYTSLHCDDPENGIQCQEDNIKLHPNDFRVFTRTTSFENVNNDEGEPIPGLKRIIVEVSWTDTRPHSVSFQTIISSLNQEDEAEE